MAKLMVHAIQRRRQSAPSAAFFLNNGNPLSSTSQPNLSKVLEAEGKEGEDRTKDVVYENREYRDRVSRASTPPLQRVSRASTPPLQRQFEEPLQGFHVVRPSSFQPREISTTPPRSVLVPKARTPVSSHHLEKLNSVETLLCEIMSRLDNLECCSRSSVRPNKVRQTRSKTKVSLKIRIFREQRQIRKHLSMIDKRTSLLTKKVDRLNSQTRIGKERPQQLDEILKFLQIEDFRGILEREHVSRDDFFLLNKPDLKEMGFPLGVRRRILNYIRN
ncbi:uncharacterized protein LOC134822720 isoform X2 [Bolinopsis microptera]|uniref:uncharacterized protein LOC134822720 isoform X2 n=1 Tax=Bolinopsis microptera TaxID=2820187 RepID=UPI003079F4ED